MSETAREIVDRYVETVTGMTPQDRAAKKFRRDMERLGKVFHQIGEAVSRALDPMQAFIDDFERKENR